MTEERANSAAIARRIVAELNAQSDSDNRNESDWDAVDECATAEAAKVYAEPDDARADELRDAIKRHIYLAFPFQTDEDRRLRGTAPRLLAAGREVLANWESGDLAASVREIQAIVGEFDAGNGTAFLLWNETDQVYASPDTFPSKAEAEAFAVTFRKRFARQGFYRNVSGENIAPSDIDLVVVPADS
jgi:hypothetical protein